MSAGDAAGRRARVAVRWSARIGAWICCANMVVSMEPQPSQVYTGILRGCTGPFTPQDTQLVSGVSFLLNIVLGIQGGQTAAWEVHQGRLWKYRSSPTVAWRSLVRHTSRTLRHFWRLRGAIADSSHDEVHSMTGHLFPILTRGKRRGLMSRR